MDACEILEYAASLDMTISCHPTSQEDMLAITSHLKNTNLVFAHPGDKDSLYDRVELLQKYDNAYIDLSGGGIYRYGTVRELINKVGCDRILFGTDYPICNPACYVQGVLYENLTDTELELIFYKNAERVYKI